MAETGRQKARWSTRYAGAMAILNIYREKRKRKGGWWWQGIVFGCFPAIVIRGFFPAAFSYCIKKVTLTLMETSCWPGSICVGDAEANTADSLYMTGK